MQQAQTPDFAREERFPCVLLLFGAVLDGWGSDSEQLKTFCIQYFGLSTLSAKTKSKTSFWSCRTFGGGDVHEEAKKTPYDRESSDRSIVFNPFPIVFRPSPIRLMLS